MKSPKKILLSYTKYAENLYIYALKTHVVNRWYSSKHQKKEYVEKNIKQSLLPIIIFTK